MTAQEQGYRDLTPRPAAAVSARAIIRAERPARQLSFRRYGSLIFLPQNTMGGSPYFVARMMPVIANSPSQVGLLPIKSKRYLDISWPCCLGTVFDIFHGL
jgi:hypothetical protein